MSREKQIEEMAKKICLATQKTNYICNKMCEKQGSCAYCKVMAEHLYDADCRKQSENETLEAVDKFRSALMNKFIDICGGNDYNKINLLRIGDTIQRTFYDVVARLKGGAE